MKRFDVGARVVEPTYGLGSVIAVEDAYTRVQFDEHGIKKFLTSMSQPRTERRAGPGRPPRRQGPQEARAQEGRRRSRCSPSKSSRARVRSGRLSLVATPTSPHSAGETIVVQSADCVWIASRKSPISLRLLTTLWARKRPRLSSRGETRSRKRL